MKSWVLKGITWNHSRALPLLVAAAKFEEYHPNVRVLWEKRSLHEFGHSTLAELAHASGFLVVDDPMMGKRRMCSSICALCSHRLIGITLKPIPCEGRRRMG
jgi:multiple sugar transport system substrate-binding protein